MLMIYFIKFGESGFRRKWISAKVEFGESGIWRKWISAKVEIRISTRRNSTRRKWNSAKVENPENGKIHSNKFKTQLTKN